MIIVSSRRKKKEERRNSLLLLNVFLHNFWSKYSPTCALNERKKASIWHRGVKSYKNYTAIRQQSRKRNWKPGSPDYYLPLMSNLSCPFPKSSQNIIKEYIVLSCLSQGNYICSPSFAMYNIKTIRQNLCGTIFIIQSPFSFINMVLRFA